VVIVAVNIAVVVVVAGARIAVVTHLGWQSSPGHQW
jgi:hypothetical protein